MNLDTTQSRLIINRLLWKQSINFNELLELVLSDYNDVFANHRLFVSQTEQGNYYSGLFTEFALATYSQQQILNLFIKFNEISLKLKSALKIILFLEEEDYLTSFRAQPNIMFNHGAYYYYGNMNTQSHDHYGFSDPELTSLFHTYFACSFHTNDSINDLPKQKFLSKSDHINKVNIQISQYGIFIGVLALLFTGISTCMTYNELVKADEVILNSSQFRNMIIKLDSINNKIDTVIVKNFEKY
ncbi:MAG TPA: hypothetical protein VFG10_07205 [Saprospiraceae bacterium]|nr:hypothetical protein [Saprospiraceae bacterium]